jgi:hypothetical protein
VFLEPVRQMVHCLFEVVFISDVFEVAHCFL